MPFPNKNKTILIEEPTYPQIIELIKLYDISVITIPRKNQTLDIEKIKNIFIEYDIKFFYITSRFQNPLGFSLSKKEKIQILKLAKIYNVYIVEDDYMADFDNNSKNDPLYTYDSSDKVIYLKSFSKIMFPGLRVGVCVLPPQLSSTFKHYKINADISSSIFSQAALEFEKAKTFVDTVKIHPISNVLEYLPPHALKTHIKLPKNINEKKLIDLCKQDNVHLIKSDPYYFDVVDNPNYYLLIELSNVSSSNIEIATNLLLDNLEKLFF